MIIMFVVFRIRRGSGFYVDDIIIVYRFEVFIFVVKLLEVVCIILLLSIVGIKL